MGRARDKTRREALRRQQLLMRFEQLRCQVLPCSEAAGGLSDDDVLTQCPEQPHLLFLGRRHIDWVGAPSQPSRGECSVGGIGLALRLFNLRK